MQVVFNKPLLSAGRNQQDLHDEKQVGQKDCPLVSGS